LKHLPHVLCYQNHNDGKISDAKAHPKRRHPVPKKLLPSDWEYEFADEKPQKEEALVSDHKLANEGRIV